MHARGKRHVPMISFVGALGALALTFLGPTFYTYLHSEYEVVLSPDFTSNQIISVEDAERSWMKVLPHELFLHSSVGACDNESPEAAEGRLICIYPATADDLIQATGATNLVGVTWRWGDQPWRILLNTEELVTTDYVQMVAAHELGHAMGLKHTPHEHTLMQPYMKHCIDEGVCVVTQSLTPTKEDVAMWHKARREAW